MNHGKRQKTKKQLSEERKARFAAKEAAEKTRLINLNASKEKAEWLEEARHYNLYITRMIYRLNIVPRIDFTHFKMELNKYWITESNKS